MLVDLIIVNFIFLVVTAVVFNISKFHGSNGLKSCSYVNIPPPLSLKVYNLYILD